VEEVEPVLKERRLDDIKNAEYWGTSEAWLHKRREVLKKRAGEPSIKNLYSPRGPAPELVRSSPKSHHRDITKLSGLFMDLSYL